MGSYADSIILELKQIAEALIELREGLQISGRGRMMGYPEMNRHERITFRMADHPEVNDYIVSRPYYIGSRLLTEGSGLLRASQSEGDIPRR